jgi:hypothetical protein
MDVSEKPAASIIRAVGSSKSLVNVYQTKQRKTLPPPPKKNLYSSNYGIYTHLANDSGAFDPLLLYFLEKRKRTKTRVVITTYILLF